MSSVIRVRVASCRTLWNDDTPTTAKTVQLGTKSLWREGGKTQIEFKLILSRKMLNPRYFFLNLSLGITSFVQLSLMWAVLRVESINNLLIWSTKMFDPVKGEAVWVMFAVTSRTRRSADLSVVINYRGLSHFSSKGELHDFVFQRLVDNLYLT